ASVADAEYALLGIVGAPAIRDAGHCLPFQACRLLQPPGEKRRLRGEFGDQGVYAFDLLQAVAGDGEAEICAPVLLDEQAGIAAVEQVELDMAGKVRRSGDRGSEAQRRGLDCGA